MATPTPTPTTVIQVDASVLPGQDVFRDSDPNSLRTLLFSLRLVELTEIVRTCSLFSSHLSATGRKAQVVERIVQLATRFRTMNTPETRQMMVYLTKTIDLQLQYLRPIRVELHPTDKKILLAHLHPNSVRHAAGSLRIGQNLGSTVPGTEAGSGPVVPPVVRTGGGAGGRGTTRPLPGGGEDHQRIRMDRERMVVLSLDPVRVTL